MTGPTLNVTISLNNTQILTGPKAIFLRRILKIVLAFLVNWCSFPGSVLVIRVEQRFSTETY